MFLWASCCLILENTKVEATERVAGFIEIRSF
jgi:hypothetical protein